MSTSPLLLLGGSFDPIHYGHIRPAMEAAAQLNCDEVSLLPNRLSPLKEQSGTTAAHKLAMLRLIADEYPLFHIDEREIAKQQPNYTIETLKEIRSEIGSRPLGFLMGYDSLATLNQWHSWQALLSYSHLIVCRRPDQQIALPDEVAALLQKTQSDRPDGSFGNIVLLNTTACPISATQIRENIAKALPIDDLTTMAVAEYICTHRLYLNAPSSGIILR